MKTILPKPLEYAGTGKPVYAMDVIIAKQEIYLKDKHNEKSRSKA